MSKYSSRSLGGKNLPTSAKVPLAPRALKFPFRMVINCNHWIHSILLLGAGAGFYYSTSLPRSAILPAALLIAISIIVSSISFIMLCADIRFTTKMMFWPSKIKSTHLNLEHPDIVSLAQNYSELLMLAQSGNARAKEALSISHQALLEVTDLLKGKSPSEESEVLYIEKRLQGITTIVDLIRSENETLSAQEIIAENEGIHRAAKKESEIRAEAISALEEFQIKTGTSSLPELQRLGGK